MVQVSNRLKFSIESYDDFSERVSAERYCLEFYFYYKFLESFQMFRLYKELYSVVL
jgi:tRNA splicing ligase